MSKDKFSDYDSTAANNTDVGNIGIQGTNRVNGFDDALREVMSHIADNFASDTIASATTTDLGSKAAHYLTISGTTTITGLGTVKAGTLKFVRFSGALTLTHNGTSLILPGATNITTVAGDTAVFVSEGSGNWRCLDYKRGTQLQTVGWELIGSATPSGASSVNFTGLSDYRVLWLRGKVRPGTDAVSIGVRTSTDGTNYDAGSSDYAEQFFFAGGTTLTGVGGAGNMHFLNGVEDVGSASGEALQFDCHIDDFNQSAYAFFKSTAVYLNNAGGVRLNFNGSIRASTTARQAIRLIASSGTLTGRVWLFGLRG